MAGGDVAQQCELMSRSWTLNGESVASYLTAVFFKKARAKREILRTRQGGGGRGTRQGAGDGPLASGGRGDRLACRSEGHRSGATWDWQGALERRPGCLATVTWARSCRCAQDAAHGGAEGSEAGPLARPLAPPEGVASRLCGTGPGRGVLRTQEGQTCPKTFTLLTHVTHL